MTQKDLRTSVKLLKAIKNIPYKEIGKQIGLKESSMYNWMREQYSLSETKSRQLQQVIENMKEQ